MYSYCELVSTWEPDMKPQYPHKLVMIIIIIMSLVVIVTTDQVERFVNVSVLF